MTKKVSNIAQNSCCDSKTETYRVHEFMISKFMFKSSNCYHGNHTAYFLKYHDHHPFKHMNEIIQKVKYYNPRKGLEIIDGKEYNQMPETNSSFKEIQYKFKFISNRPSNRMNKKVSPDILNVFDENEMKQILSYFNNNKDYRHSRKIRYKE